MYRLRKSAGIILLSCLALSPVFSAPQNKSVDLDASNWSLGIFLGAPTGISAQLDLSDTQALEFKAAWRFEAAGQDEGGSLTLQGNYVLWFPGVLVFNSLDFPPFVGAGAVVRISGDLPLLGLHLPFGVRYRFQKAPIEVALELGAGLSLFPSTSFMGSGGLAVRWMFK